MDTQGSASRHGRISATLEVSTAVTLGTLRAVGGDAALPGLYGAALLLGAVGALVWWQHR